ncbi:ATP-dependent helicase HrpB, partial [Micromonospora craterilacus]
AVARETLSTLGALGPDGRITARGRAIAAAGAHPRLARALLDGAARVGADRAAEVVALLAEESATGPGDDLAAAWRRLRAGTDPAATARWRTEKRRLRAALPAGARDTTPPGTRTGPENGAPVPLPDDLAAGLLVGLAYPERLARVRRPGGSAYLMSGGTAAELAPGSALAGAGWLAVAVADRSPGAPTARVRLAAALDEATAREAGGPLLRVDREVGWSGTDVVAREVVRLGAIELVERPLRRPDPDKVAAALLDGLRSTGLDLLTWTPAARALRERLTFCRHALGDDWPDVSDAALLADAAGWLGPELATARRRADLARIDVAGALRRQVPWPLAGRLDELAPERITVPSGSRIRLDYADPAAPVLAVRLQETFGWTDAPHVAGGRVPVLLHLLSPAGRPVAVTADLASFWRSGYRQVRAELRGRYPRHPWPEDPTTATPTRQAARRR